jgi:hypothetical protein
MLVDAGVMYLLTHWSSSEMKMSGNTIRASERKKESER